MQDLEPGSGSLITGVRDHIARGGGALYWGGTVLQCWYHRYNHRLPVFKSGKETGLLYITPWFYYSVDYTGITTRWQCSPGIWSWTYLHNLWSYQLITSGLSWAGLFQDCPIVTSVMRVQMDGQPPFWEMISLFIQTHHVTQFCLVKPRGLVTHCKFPPKVTTPQTSPGHRSLSLHLDPHSLNSSLSATAGMEAKKSLFPPACKISIVND